MRLLVVLAALALAACPSSTIRKGVRIDPALAMLIPADTTLLAGARIDQLRNTPLFKKYVDGGRIDPLERFVKQTGLDPRKDLWEFLLASDGKDAVVMARGKFSPTGLEPRLELEGARRSSYKGYTMIGSDQMAVLFMNSTTAVAGRPSRLQTVVDHREKSDGPPLPLRPLIEALPSSAQAWIVTLGGVSPVKAPERSNLQNLERIFAGMENGSLAADLRKGLRLDAQALCGSDSEAKQIHGALRGFIGMGRLSTPDDKRQLLRVYDAIEVKQDGRTVRVEADLPMELLEEAANAIGVFSRR